MSKQKILITGNGYVGRGLCEILKNKYDITVIDNTFYNDRVAWLVENNIEFFQRDLFDTRDLLLDKEIVFHTAGITQVPQRQEDSNPTIDDQIMRTGVDATRYLIKNINRDCKVVFLSTHVVFEGYANCTISLDETVPALPMLAYAKSKDQSEIDLANSNKNYIIARLGSVYGYNPSIRWKIVANWFSKMTVEENKIKVFGGQCYKPMIGINDCCAALKMLAEGNYNKEIYHLVNENITVNEIAAICKKYSPNLIIEETIDKITNLGYSLSNAKLLSTGFKFEHTIDESIDEMIKIWTNKPKLNQ